MKTKNSIAYFEHPFSKFRLFRAVRNGQIVVVKIVHVSICWSMCFVKCAQSKFAYTNNYQFSSTMMGNGNNWKRYTNNNGNEYFEEQLNGQYNKGIRNTTQKNWIPFNSTDVTPNTVLENFS